MTSDSGVWKPSAQEQSKKLAGPCEIINLKLTSGGAAANVAFYDAIDSIGATPSNLRWILDASTQDADSDRFTGLVFKKGLFAVCEQGFDQNPAVCYAAKKYIV